MSSAKADFVMLKYTSDFTSANPTAKYVIGFERSSRQITYLARLLYPDEGLLWL